MLPKLCCSLLLLSCGLLCLGNFPAVQSAKILSVYAFPGKSHFMMHTALIKELINRGHEITMITAFSLEKHNLGSNYTEILIETVHDFWSDITNELQVETIFDLSKMDFITVSKMMRILAYGSTEHVLKQPKVQAFINSTAMAGQFDLLLAEQFYQEPFLALAYKHKIPIISTSTLGYVNYFAQMMGLIFPWAYVPHGFAPYTDQMSFTQRLINTYYSLYEDLDREWNYFVHMDKMTQKYFGHLNFEFPSISEMQKQISVILMNSYVPLTTPRPAINGLVSVGGVHIGPTQPLPADIEQFLNEAQDGAIFFSLGSNVQSKDMPPEKLKIFFDVFAQLKQRVLWKFENETVKNIPKNVMVKKWLPQADILAHANTKVFITHGGLFSTQEATHFAVPVLGIPFYCDQQLNINKMVLAGYAVNLDFLSITHDNLKTALLDLVENPKYQQNVDKYSQIFRDRPVSAMEESMYWIEYVIRYKGAPQIRSAGLQLSWYQMYLLDVIAFVIGCVALTLYMLKTLIRRLLSKEESAVKVKSN